MVKRSGRGVEDPLPSSAEVMNQWSCISSLLVCLQGVDRDNFTSCFLLNNVIPRCIELLEKLLVHQSVTNMTQPTIVISTVHSPSINFIPYLSKIILILSCYLSAFPKLCFKGKTHVLIWVMSNICGDSVNSEDNGAIYILHVKYYTAYQNFRQSESQLSIIETAYAVERL
jgi:hypothetical protein